MYLVISPTDYGSSRVFGTSDKRSLKPPGGDFILVSNLQLSRENISTKQCKHRLLVDSEKAGLHLRV